MVKFKYYRRIQEKVCYVPQHISIFYSIVVNSGQKIYKVKCNIVGKEFFRFRILF
jgi:hypothetical protein